MLIDTLIYIYMYTDHFVDPVKYRGSQWLSKELPNSTILVIGLKCSIHRNYEWLSFWHLGPRPAFCVGLFNDIAIKVQLSILKLK